MNFYRAVPWCNDLMRLTTLCGGLCQTAYLGVNCCQAVHNLVLKQTTTMIKHKCTGVQSYFPTKWNKSIHWKTNVGLSRIFDQ